MKAARAEPGGSEFAPARWLPFLRAERFPAHSAYVISAAPAFTWSSGSGMSAAQRDSVPVGGPSREAGTEAGDAGSRKARGRPRLTESDRARRRLESRKKYDVRRVYLGEAHGPWVDLRRRSGWSDAKLAAYLLGLERGQRAGRRG